MTEIYKRAGSMCKLKRQEKNTPKIFARSHPKQNRNDFIFLCVLSEWDINQVTEIFLVSPSSVSELSNRTRVCCEGYIMD